MRPRKRPRQLAAIALMTSWLAFGSAAAVQAVETLATSRTLESGSVQTSSQSFVNARSVTNAAATTGDVAVLASLSGRPGGASGSKIGEWRLASGAQQGTIVRRDLSDSSSDWGVINLAWIFQDLAPGAAIHLQHRSTNGRTIRTEKITLVAIPMTTQPAATVLAHALDFQDSFSFATSSTNFVPVEKPDGSQLLATVRVPPVTVPKAIFIAATLGTSTPGVSSANGAWKLQYNPSTSPPEVACQDGIDVGTEVRRSLSGSSDSGALMLYAVAEGLDPGTYEIRLCTQSRTPGQAIASSNAALVAFSLSFVGNGAGGHFPHFQDTVLRTEVSSGNMKEVPTLLEGFSLQAPSNVFLAWSFTAFTTTSGLGDFGEFETCIQGSGGGFPFGRDQAGSSQEVRRFFSQANDIGAGGQVGLALGLGIGTYSARGCASVTGNPVVLERPNLVGFIPRSVDDATVPVTLSWFRARGHGELSVEWATTTEVGNLGFNLYEVDRGQMRRLNDDLIASQHADSIAPAHYRFEARGVRGDALMIEDVNIFGRSTLRGPFALGQDYGVATRAQPPTPWQQFRRSHALAEAKRKTSAQRPLGLGPAPFDEALLAVDRDGLYRVSFEDLLAAGVDFGGAPAARLVLENRGKPVPMRVVSRGRFGSGSFIEFIGRALDTLYTRTNVYSLRVDRYPGLAIQPDSRLPRPGALAPQSYFETRTIETNRAYHFASPTTDPWYDERLLATSGPVELYLDLELPGWVSNGGPSTLAMSLWGVTDYPQAPDHHVVVDVNDVELANVWFDGLTDQPIVADISEAITGEQGNLIRVHLPHDTGAPVDLVHYDHYRVTYPRHFQAQGEGLRFEAAGEVFEVTGLPSDQVLVYRVTEAGSEFLERVAVRPDPAGGYVARFVGTDDVALYWVSTVAGLQSPTIEPAAPPADISSRQARLLILSHPDFIDALEPLVSARRAEGYTVEVVDIQEVYRQFGYATVDPEALRAYIRFAHRSLGTEAVLLVGGDTYDYHGYLGNGAMSFLPSIYAPTGPIVRYAPVDPLYTDVDRDGVPDLPIGRFPVRDETELQVLIQKTLDFPALGESQTGVLAADAFDPVSNTSFGDLSDALAVPLGDGWDLTRAYIDDEGLEGARSMLIDGINQGVALTSYFGHSGPSVWSFQGLFDRHDAEQLTNSRRPTVVAQWGCWNTYYVSPSYDTLSHALLLSGDRGAAAVMGATTLTQVASEQALGAYFFAELAEPGSTLGEALRDAKQRLAAAQPDLLDVILGWTLLGDPTLVIEP